MEYRGFGLVCSEGDWFIYENGQLVGKAVSDTEAMEMIDDMLDNEEQDG